MSDTVSVVNDSDGRAILMISRYSYAEIYPYMVHFIEKTDYYMCKITSQVLFTNRVTGHRLAGPAIYYFEDGFLSSYEYILNNSSCCDEEFFRLTNKEGRLNMLLTSFDCYTYDDLQYDLKRNGYVS